MGDNSIVCWSFYDKAQSLRRKYWVFPQLRYPIALQFADNELSHRY